MFTQLYEYLYLGIHYKYICIYITLTSIILLPSDIISISLCLISIKNNLSLAGSSENSSNNCIFFGVI